MKSTLLFAKRAYLNSPVRPIVRKVGLEGYMQSAFRSSMYYLSDSQITLQIAGQEATFDASHPDDARLLSRDIERPVIEDFLQTIDSDDTFFDIGAHIGTYSCLVALKIGAENVVAFEPSPNNVKRFRRNLELNDLDVHINQIAISDSKGTATFKEATDSLEGSEATGQIIEDEREEDTITVDIETVDNLLADGDSDPPTVVKLDIEGAETNAVKGMRETLSRPECRLLYCEVHPEDMEAFGTDPDELRDELESCGFTYERFHEAYGDRYFVRCRK